MPSASMSSPIGPLTLVSDGTAITALQWGEGGTQDTTPELTEALAQLAAYFKGGLTRFDLPLNVAGSEFQRRVCDAMREIPFGDTVTYGDLAARIGASAQAIGTGCGGNPIPVVIPCHRVLAASGLGGYSGQGGVETKVWLLRHEGAAGLLI